MLKYYFKIILLLFILTIKLSLKSNAQQSITNFKLNNNIKLYYDYINKAELLLLKNKTKEASLYYDKAFTKNKLPFVKDLFNAFIANIKIENEKKALIQYYKLRKIGVVDSQLIINKKVGLFINKINISKINFKNKSSPINSFLKDTLTNLVKTDQYHRLLSGGNYSNYLQEIKTDDSITGIKLSQLIKKYGFPNEYDLGIEDSKNFYWLNFYVIIWHQGQHQQTNFTNEILEAINKGKIESHIAAFLIDKYYGEIGIGDNSIFGNSGIKGIKLDKDKLDSCCFVRNFSIDNANQKIQLYNQNQMRKKLGVESLEENQQKIIFKFNGSPYLFSQYTGAGLVYYNIDSKEDLKIFDLKNMIHIKNTQIN